jgi:hypothetical protein
VLEVQRVDGVRPSGADDLRQLRRSRLAAGSRNAPDVEPLLAPARNRPLVALVGVRNGQLKLVSERVQVIDV